MSAAAAIWAGGWVEPEMYPLTPPLFIWRFLTREDADRCITSQTADVREAIVPYREIDGKMKRSPVYDHAPWEVRLQGATFTIRDRREHH